MTTELKTTFPDAFTAGERLKTSAPDQWGCRDFKVVKVDPYALTIRPWRWYWRVWEWLCEKNAEWEQRRAS